MSVRPRLSYHVVDASDDGTVNAILPMEDADVRINGGFFVLGGTSSTICSRARTSWTRRLALPRKGDDRLPL